MEEIKHQHGTLETSEWSSVFFFFFLMNESGHVMEGQMIDLNNSEFTIDHNRSGGRVKEKKTSGICTVFTNFYSTF